MEYKVGQWVRFFDDDAEGVIIEGQPDMIFVKLPCYDDEVVEIDTPPTQSLVFEVIEKKEH